MSEPEGPGPPRRAASPPGGGTVTEATASPTGIHPAPGCIPGVHPTVSLEAPRAELTGLELIDESTRQMPSNSISTNNESLTEVNRATPASLSQQVQDGVGTVSTDSVGPLEYSAYVGAPTGGSSIDERGQAQRSVKGLS